MFSWENIDQRFLSTIQSRSYNDSIVLKFLKNDYDIIENDTYLFNWNNINMQGKDNYRLIKFIENVLCIDELKNAEMYKYSNGDSVNVGTVKTSIRMDLDKNNKKVIMNIDNCKAYNLQVDDKLNIYEAKVVMYNKDAILIQAIDKSINIKLDKKNKKAYLEINNGRVYNLTMRKENGKYNIYYNV